MIALDTSTAAAYLAGRGIAVQSVVELGGGVSNTVLMVEPEEGPRFVLKQALARLRVEQEWLSDPRRIHREAAAMRRLADVPQVLFEDRDNCIFAMTAAPEGSEPWKTRLLQGEIEPGVASTIGRMHAAMIRTPLDAEFADKTIFDQLRLDPYYRATALRNPDVAPILYGLVEELLATSDTLVHGDWSPKNFLVWDANVMAIDFEVVHAGDPTFDVAFLLNHLVLKSYRNPEWRALHRRAAKAYLAELPLSVDHSAFRHLAALMLARVDGKSPVEYLQATDRIRQAAKSLLREPAANVDEVFDRL